MGNKEWEVGNKMWEMRNEKWETRSWKWGNGKQERCWIGPWEVGNETQTRILITEVSPSAQGVMHIQQKWLGFPSSLHVHTTSLTSWVNPLLLSTCTLLRYMYKIPVIREIRRGGAPCNSAARLIRRSRLKDLFADLVRINFLCLLLIHGIGNGIFA